MLIAASLPAGTRLGPYRVLQVLGRGSVGAVYRATDRSGGAPVALKVLPWPTPSAHGPFGRELASASRLHHPDIVTVVSIGDAPGLGWLAMTLAPGHDLQRHTHAAALLPPATVAAIGARIAAALAHAHRQGVVHRDVKPANVLVDLDVAATTAATTATTASVMLTDFGVARIAQRPGAAAASATRSGLLLGTMAYMSPEQLAGAHIDAASDLYSLGATLFHLLSGRLPHEAASLSQQMHAIANLPARALLALRPEVGAALSATVARLLAKSPAERGSDGDALAAELRAISGALPAAGAESLADPRHNSRQ